mgnify:CR=1 FL=1
MDRRHAPGGGPTADSVRCSGGTGRLGGFPVGVVANQKRVIRKQGRIEIGGVIYGDAADKAARFVLNCNQAGVPIVFLHDVNGFMVGRDSERDGIIRRGAKLVNAVSNSVVPRISVILGGSYGAGHYAMSGKAFAPRFIFALPSARYAVMGGQQAASTLLDVQAAQLRRQGREVDAEALEELRREVAARYDAALDVRYAAARLWVDEVIAPPHGGLTGYRDAVALALKRIERGEVETTWASASPVGAPADPLPSDPEWAGEVVYTDERSLDCEIDANAVWDVVEGIGGENGWYSFPLAWTIRGWLDRFAGGVGLNRGRRNPHTLHTGDALDFWRVERIDRPKLLRLRAEMLAPGGAWLEWRVEPLGPDSTRLYQRAIFFPKGIAGRLYWYSLLPFHGIIFSGMLENIAGTARKDR